GTWIESIQITKGAGSVVNGFESMAGQINLELIKPMESEKLLFNAYLDEMTRSEVNLNLSKVLNDKWSTGLLLHTDGAFMHADRNKDGFLDAPLQKQVNALNRWNYHDGKKWESQFGISGTYQKRQGGQTHFKESEKKLAHAYGIGIESKRGEAFAKLGRMFADKPYKSFGSMFSVTHHDQNSFFGLRDYNAKQSTFYTNLIYQTIIGNTFHKIKFGSSFIGDMYNEKFTDSAFKRNEWVPGVFSEYAYGDTSKISLVTGLRADYHNIYGLMITPRIHARLALGENTTMRASAGKGYRTPNIWMENSGLWASSRKVFILEKPSQEESWNYGASIIHNFSRNKQKGYISADFFRSEFVNQVIIDVDAKPQEVHIYNLDGKSFANSYQAEVAYDVLKNLNVKVAYKISDVKATYHGKLLEKPLVPQNRFLATAQYSTRFKKWVFDFTQSRQGKSRLPNTGSNPENFKRAEYSTGYWMTNVQVTRNFKKFSVYAGSENMFDFRQPNPIISAENPFGPYFDASMIWAPVDGRRIYAGIRYKLER
ncbi:MAG: TonB-dependent receptor plug domain-containing protein, partial [Bacteroidia bacterium]